MPFFSHSKFHQKALQDPSAAPAPGWALGQFRPSSPVTLLLALPLKSVHFSKDKGIP